MRYLIKTNLINKLAMYMFTAFVTCVTCMFYCTDCGTGNAFADRMVYAFGGVPYGYDPFKEGIPLEYNAYILQMVLLLTLGGLTDANIKADLIRRFGIKGFVIKRGIVLAIQIIIWGLINIIVVGLMSGNQGILEKNLIILYIS